MNHRGIFERLKGPKKGHITKETISKKVRRTTQEEVETKGGYREKVRKREGRGKGGGGKPEMHRINAVARNKNNNV